MNIFDSIRKAVPFLKHLNAEEADYFFKSGSVVSIQSGQYADVKRTNSLNIVLTGILEVETIGNAEAVYFTAGSFFGFMPFVENRKRGNIKALLDSTLFVIQEEDIYRFFLRYHKSLRGYIRMITALGYEMSETGKKYFELKGRVVSVFSRGGSSGRSFLASSLGLALSGEDTVLMDLSYSGTSIFDILCQRLTAPISEREPDSGRAQSLIDERLVHVEDKLFMLNIANSSRIKVDPSIVGTLLFLLSRRFRYIIADISDSDSDLRDAMIARSDMVFALTAGKRDLSGLNELLDDIVDDFQRIFYVRNDFYSPEKGPFMGGFTLEKDTGYCEEPGLESLARSARDGRMKPFIDKITKKESALVVQSLSVDSISFGQFFIELQQSGKTFDCIYTSSLSYFLLAIYLLSRDEKDLADSLRRFYSPEQLNRNMDIAFPERFIFKNNRVYKYADELAGSRRIEMFHTLPVCKLNSDAGVKRFSSGSMSGIMTASYAREPFFEPVRIGGNYYNSGYPSYTVSPAELFRADYDDIFYLSVMNRDRIDLAEQGLNDFYISSIRPELKPLKDESYYLQPGKNLHIELSESEFKFDKIADKTKRLSQSLVVRIL